MIEQTADSQNNWLVKEPWGWAVQLLLGCIAVPLVTLGIVLTAQYVPWGVASVLGSVALGCGMLLLGYILVAFLVTSRRQRRNLGPLLLIGDYAMPLPRWASRRLFLGVFLLYTIIIGSSVFRSTESILATVGAVAFWLMFISFSIIGQFARWEIHESGIWSGLEPLPWSRLVAYRWEEGGVVAFQTGSLAGGVLPKFKVPEAIRDRVDELLGQYLPKEENIRGSLCDAS